MRRHPLRKHPSISLDVLDFVAPKIQHALREASANLTNLGIPHAICGGVAVGAYGHVRATKDVDFLSGEEAFVNRGGLASFAPGVTFAIDGIATDMVSMPNTDPFKDLTFLADELEDPYDFDGMPIVSPEALVAMKLIAYRRNDQDDILKVIEAGATSFNKVRKYLDNHGRADLHMRLSLLEHETD